MIRVKRQGLIVWFQHRKHIKHIKRYGHLMYVSRKMRFGILYVNQDEVETVEANLMKLPYVKQIEHSQKPFIDTNFENSKPDQAKMYDYK